MSFVFGGFQISIDSFGSGCNFRIWGSIRREIILPPSASFGRRIFVWRIHYLVIPIKTFSILLRGEPTDIVDVISLVSIIF